MSTHKQIDEETLNNLLYLSRLSPESTDIATLKKQVDEIVGYFDILSKYDDSEKTKKIVRLSGFQYSVLTYRQLATRQLFSIVWMV